MTVNTYMGRTLPLTDWEGDDAIRKDGRFVTCMDTALGRAVAWATNGRVTKDGKFWRSKVSPRDMDGINFNQAADALHSTYPSLVLRQENMTKAEAKAHLRAGKGLLIIGTYSAIPRAYRHQDRGSFYHAMFVTHINASGMMRLYDPLDRDTKRRGRVVPASILWPFIATLDNRVAYVPLHRL